MCTVQITVFADGVPRVKPLLIFSGKGLRIQEKERDQYDKRVRVVFQPNAWCDEPTMKDWIYTDWNFFFLTLLHQDRVARFWSLMFIVRNKPQT